MKESNLKLFKQDKDSEVVGQLFIADTFFLRAKGLLGEQDLEPGTGLWIHHCSSVHTFFMRFAIDAVFVNRHLVVKAVYPHLKPWRITWPVWGACSVFEFPASTLTRIPISVGDQLYVGT